MPGIPIFEDQDYDNRTPTRKSTMTGPEITVTQSEDGGELLILIERDGVPVLSVNAQPDGTVTVGYWVNDEQWTELHSIDPA